MSGEKEGSPMTLPSRMAVLLAALVVCGWPVGGGSGRLGILSGELLSEPLKTTQESRPMMNELPFETLANGASFHAMAAKPRLQVLTSKEDAAPLLRALGDKKLAGRIQEIDFGASLIVAVFRGRMGSSGYGITVQKVCAAQDSIQLTVDLSDPAGMAASVITYPYHLILLSREVIGDTTKASWLVYTSEGKLLLRQPWQEAFGIHRRERALPMATHPSVR